MMIKALLVFHVAVLGYWLGAEFVINSTFRHASYASGMKFEDRNRLLDHVMNVDQHVRYAFFNAGWNSLKAGSDDLIESGIRASGRRATCVLLLWSLIAAITELSVTQLP